VQTNMQQFKWVPTLLFVRNKPDGLLDEEVVLQLNRFVYKFRKLQKILNYIMIIYKKCIDTRSPV